MAQLGFGLGMVPCKPQSIGGVCQGPASRADGEASGCRRIAAGYLQGLMLLLLQEGLSSAVLANDLGLGEGGL